MLKAISLTALLLVAGWAHGAGDLAAQAQRFEQISAAADKHRLALDFDGQTFSGPGWVRLLMEGRAARFFLVGEEHGIAENPLLLAQLFTALAPSGYRRLAIEVSPPMAEVLDDALLDEGLEGLRKLYAMPGGEPAFFGLAEEAEMLADVRAAVPEDEPALWGADYEVAGDRTLLRLLAAKPKPGVAETALASLIEASTDGWSRHAATGDARHIFTFAGAPELVRRVERAWPERDDASAWALDTLEETLEINRLWADGQAFASNRQRANFLRTNFLRYWRAARQLGDPPRVMAKFGANHMVRGRNLTQTFDLGALLPELAALDDETAFSLLVLPGNASPTAVLNASTWSYESAAPKDGYRKGLEPLLAAAQPKHFTLIDLRPVRPVVAARVSAFDPALSRVVFGFDMMLVMSGSTAASELAHD